MFLAIHSPMFGEPNVDAVAITCPGCGRNEWNEQAIEECNPGDEFTCECGKKVTINWGLVEPDHLSSWLSSEHCPHRLCKVKYRQLSESMGWKQ
jgi:hypothetical protein